MSTCSVCDKNFDMEQKRCILHCKKNAKNGWYTVDTNNKKIWDSKKVKLFWEKIHTETSGINVVVGDKEIFEEITKEYNSEPFQYDFIKVIFPASVIDDIQDKSFFRLDKDINIYFDKCIFLGFTDFELISKAKNVIFNNCRFFENVEFKQMEFNGLFLFENCKVCQDIKFQNITFKKTTSFIKSKFHKELNFIHSRFDDLALFNEIKVEKLLLDNTFFRGEANFLDMTANMANRETARIIKNSFEQQNNIIEANKFYALEMQKREGELTKDIKSGKNIVDWLIFKAHAISSNHSQDSVLPILWILNIALFYSMSISTFHHNNALAFISALFMISFIFSKTTLLKIMLLANFLIFYFLSYINLDYLTDKINPFSIMTSKDSITFGLLMFKITIAYLIYQFIVSVRQNTRRK